MTTDDTQGVVQTILAMGEERLGDVVNQLLANDRFVQTLQNTVTSSITAKRTVDRGLETLYGVVNVPTLEDVDQVRDKLDDLGDLLAEIDDRLRGFETRLQKTLDDAGAKKKPAKKASAKSATSKKKASKKASTQKSSTPKGAAKRGAAKKADTASE